MHPELRQLLCSCIPSASLPTENRRKRHLHTEAHVFFRNRPLSSFVHTALVLHKTSKLLTDKHHDTCYNALCIGGCCNVAKADSRQECGNVVERSNVLCHARCGGQVVRHATCKWLPAILAHHQIWKVGHGWVTRLQCQAYSGRCASGRLAYTPQPGIFQPFCNCRVVPTGIVTRHSMFCFVWGDVQVLPGMCSVPTEAYAGCGPAHQTQFRKLARKRYMYSTWHASNGDDGR